MPNILFWLFIFLASSSAVCSQAPRTCRPAVAFPKRPVKLWLVYSPKDPRYLLKHKICFNWHGSEFNVSQHVLGETEFLWLTASIFVKTTVGQRLAAVSGSTKPNVKSQNKSWASELHSCDSFLSLLLKVWVPAATGRGLQTIPDV